MYEPIMRAKFVVHNVEVFKNSDGSTGSEKLSMGPICRADGYPADGSDEDNTFAKWSPSGSFWLQITNPALFGKFAIGDKFYMDFTKAS